MTTTIRIVAASGVYLRGQLQRLCDTVKRRGGRTGTAHQVIDGYLLRATKSRGKVVGTLMDMPAYLWFACSVRTSIATETWGVIAPVVTGRDLVAVTAQAIPAAVTVNARPARVGSFAAPAGSIGSHCQPLHYRLFEHNMGLTAFVAHSPASTVWETSMNREDVALVCDLYRPAMYVQRIEFSDTHWTDIEGGWGSVSDDFAFSSVRIFFSEAIVHADHGFRIYPQATEVPDNWGKITSVDIRPWAIHLPIQVFQDGSRAELLSVFSAFKQASGLDPHGSAAVVAVGIIVLYSASGVDVSYANMFTVDPLLSSNPAERPLLLDRVHAGTSESFDYYELNYQAPAYMAKTGAKVSCMVRWAALTAADPLDDTYWHYTAKLVQVDPLTGASVTHAVMTPSLADTSEGADADWWHWAAVGMDSDGVTAVYVAMFNWLVSEDPLVWDVGLGIVTADENGITSAFRVADPGCYAFLGRLNASVHLNNPDSGNLGNFSTLNMVSDGVTYIGNGKFVFPVSTTAPTEVINSTRWTKDAALPDPREFPPEMPMDFSLAQYVLGDSSITVLSTVRSGLTYGDAFALPGRVTVAQQEIADEETGVITQSAVLIASIGNTTAFAYGVLQGSGETYISYDSGVTWQQCADTGSGCGVYFTGSVASGFHDGHNTV